MSTTSTPAAPIMSDVVTALVIDACGRPVLVTWPVERHGVDSIDEQLGCADLDVVDAGAFRAYACGNAMHLHNANPQPAHTLACHADATADDYAVWGAALIVRRADAGAQSLRLGVATLAT
ncbi:hypothetical protein [Dermacoccus barathri]|uniref:Uncharacterized protein n=1 Tax=Dermacoccus barathri TaxID=322601 RepID=A0ABN2BZ02_9MICO